MRSFARPALKAVYVVRIIEGRAIEMGAQIPHDGLLLSVNYLLRVCGPQAASYSDRRVSTFEIDPDTGDR